MSDLGKELFALIEGDQGSAFISDSVEEMDDDQVIRIAVASLTFTKRTAAKLERFLQKHIKEKRAAEKSK